MTMSKRLLLRVELAPVGGDRFQPTGFPDLGAATFERYDEEHDRWLPCLVVESEQSMANRLEATAWDALADSPFDVFEGLPYVRVLRDDGTYVTSSRTEAHRLASAFVKDSTLDGTDMKTVIRDRLGLADDRPLAPREIAAAVFALDPFCLVHGVFFAESAKVWPGQPKIARALMAGIDAVDVRRAELGGVKKDHVRHSIGETGGSAEGFGTIPFHRTEWTARQIVANFSLDRLQLRSYGLPEEAMALLDAIARWEVRALLDGSLRLRTACDLEPRSDDVVDGRSGEALPSIDELTDEVRRGIAACAGLVGDGGPIDVTWAPRTRSTSS
jgi:CRISPR-associated protein Csb1